MPTVKTFLNAKCVLRDAACDADCDADCDAKSPVNPHECSKRTTSNDARVLQFCAVANRNIDDEDVFRREESRRFVLKEPPTLTASAKLYVLCIRRDELRPAETIEVTS